MAINKINGVSILNARKVQRQNIELLSKVGTISLGYPLFRVEIQTTSSPQDFKLYLNDPSGLEVDWGDSSTNTYNSTGLVTHSYATAGTRQIKFTAGTASRIAFGETGCTPTLVRKVFIVSPSLGLTSGQMMFKGCSGITYFAPNFFDAASGGLTNTSEMFRTVTGFNENLGAWDTSNITGMSSMLAYCNFNNAGSDTINNWDTSACTNMFAMFENNFGFNQPIGNWDVGEVVYLGNMFLAGNPGSIFNQDISGWRPAKCTYFANMFDNNKVFNHPVNDWVCGAATTLRRMFAAATSFNQRLDGWSVTNVTTAELMLSGSAFDQTNYDLLLPAWEAQAVQNSVKFHAGTAKYDDEGAPGTARAALIADHSWTITDGGAD